ncbi:MAG: AAA family ATPase [Patescibacteria group bacterium]|nr:AAA family ATPase [Patescibacteria group bacterium]MDD4303908.1 AAA family ATPase [Patescibacteria group bacterium]MDD4695105.1 AAA family ATPase [Patescibacteria group bacterium]
MFLDKIKINLYKSIKNPIDLDLNLMNTFIGQNNSGKSNILDAIELCIDPTKDNTSLFYDKSNIILNIEFTEFEVKEFLFPSDRANLILKNQKRILSFKKKDIEYDEKISNYLSSKIKRLNENVFLDLDCINEDFKNIFKYKQNFYEFQYNLKKHFPKISTTKNALDINYEHKGIKEGDRDATIDWLGSGFSRVFTILLYIYHPEYNIIMIDEPENHLHPAMIRKLLWAMQNSNSGQILFTTHSPLFITPVSLPQLIKVVKKENITSVLTIKNKNYNLDRLIKELNADNLEMFFSDEVVLVEGVSDKLLFTSLINNFYMGEKDIKVIQTYGKGNAVVYAEVLNIFDIPYVMIFDRDMLQGNYLRDLLNRIDLKLKNVSGDNFIKELKKYRIFVLPNGDLEANYPRKYQKYDSKSENALYASSSITEEDFNSLKMKNLKEIINSL